MDRNDRVVIGPGRTTRPQPWPGARVQILTQATGPMAILFVLGACTRDKGAAPVDTGDGPTGVCADVPGTIFDGVMDYPSTRYGDVVIRSCLEWSPLFLGAHQSGQLDGPARLVIANPFEDTTDVGGDISSGAVDVVSFPSWDQPYLRLEDATAHSLVTTQKSHEWSGSHVDNSADIDGDGYRDMLVGSVWGPEGTQSAGRRNVGAWFVPGPIAGTIMAEDVGVRFSADAVNTSMWEGVPVVVGDVTGDGWQDVALPLSSGGLGYAGAGRVALLAGPLLEDIDLDQAPLWVEGGMPPVLSVPTVANACDINGDGISDLGVSYYDQDNGSMVRVFLGPIEAPRPSGTEDLRLYRPTDVAISENIYGETEYFGEPVDCSADYDQDGLPNLVVSDRGWDEPDTIDAGAIWLVGASIDASASLQDAAIGRIVGSTRSHRAGYWLATGGDLDGDSFPDIVTGSNPSNEEHLEYPDPGTWIMLGPFEGTATLADGYEVHANRTGPMSIAHDLDGDDIDDLMMSDYGIEYDDYHSLDEYGTGIPWDMGTAVHVWLSSKSTQWPRPWAPAAYPE